MHVAEGALASQVLLGGAALAAAGVAVGLKKMDYDRVPQVAVMSSAFFVASLVHVPIGPSSVHLILNGLCGVMLGWAAFPALLVALFLQALLFGFGGVTALGVNTVLMAAPGVLCYYLYGSMIRNRPLKIAFWMGAAAGVTGIALGAVLVGLSLLASSGNFVTVVKLIVVAHLPVMVIEGLITGSAVVFLRKVRPEILEAPITSSIKGPAYA